MRLRAGGLGANWHRRMNSEVGMRNSERRTENRLIAEAFSFIKYFWAQIFLSDRGAK